MDDVTKLCGRAAVLARLPCVGYVVFGGLPNREIFQDLCSTTSCGTPTSE